LHQKNQSPFCEHAMIADDNEEGSRSPQDAHQDIDELMRKAVSGLDGLAAQSEFGDMTLTEEDKLFLHKFGLKFLNNGE